GRMVSIVGELYLDLRTATDQRLVVEVGLARAAVPEVSLDAEARLARNERLERRLAITGGEVAPAAAGPTAGPAVAEPPAKKAAAATTGEPDPRPEATPTPAPVAPARPRGHDHAAAAPPPPED